MISSVHNLSSAMNQLVRGVATGVRQLGEGDDGLNLNRPVDQVDRSRPSEVETTERRNPRGGESLERDTARVLAEKTAVKASVAVLKSEDMTLGTLLDVVG